MRLMYQTLKSIFIDLNIEMKKNINIKILGDIIINTSGGTLNLGNQEFTICICNGKVLIKAKGDIKSLLIDTLGINDIEIFFNNFMWLNYLDFMDVTVDGYTYPEILKKILDDYCRYNNCRCLDILCFINSRTQESIKYFKGGILSKVFYSKKNDSIHLNVVDMTLENFLRDYTYHNIISVAPNFETPDKTINFKQVVKDCVKHNVTYSRVQAGGKDAKHK